MGQIAKIPRELEDFMGPMVTDKFVDFLNATFLNQGEDMIGVVSERFEKKLLQETAGIRLEIAELRSETRTEIAQMRAEFAELRTEVHQRIEGVRLEVAGNRTDIASLRAEIKTDLAGVQKEISGIHRAISSQTKRILAAIATAAVVYPTVNRLLQQLMI